VAGVLALFVLACGVVNILSALVWIDPTRLHWLRQNLPLEVTLGSRSLTALAGLLEIALSWSLLRRKRQGWLIATVLLGGSAVLHLFKGLDVEEAAISAAAGLALLAYRRQFTVRSDPFGWAQALRAAVFFALGTCAYGVLGLWLLRRHFTPDFSLGAALQTTLAQLSSLAPLSLTPRDNSHTARWLLDSLDAAAIAAVVYTAGLFFQPVADRVGGAQHGAREAVLAILRRHGAQPQAYFLLMPGLTYMFSPSRQSVLGYRVIGGVAVVLRDPCGPDMEVPALLVAFRDRCHAHDWLPCFLSATQRWLPQLLGLGWHCMKIGEEALLDLPGLAFTGKRWQDVRTALHRLPREGYRAEWYDLIADPRGWLPELERISEIWLAQQR
jgi:phosphatidylglycerol lysyltransferase